jgi:hypothetical protein
MAGKTRVHFEDLCEDQGRSGDGRYAIAYALLQLASAQEHTARALERLGTADAATPMGAIELLAGEVKQVSQAIASLADGLSDSN